MASCNKPYDSPVKNNENDQGDQQVPEFDECPACFGFKKIVPSSIYMKSRTSWQALQPFHLAPVLPTAETVGVLCEDSPALPENKNIPVDMYGRWAEIKDKAPQDANEQLILAGQLPFNQRFLREKHPEDRFDNLSLEDFTAIKYIGGGGFGSIFSASYTYTGKTYAIKAQERPHTAKILAQIDNLIFEKKIMMSVRHPFLINVLDTFADQYSLYMVMENMTGDLSELLKQVYGVYNLRVNKSLQMLYTAQIVLAVEYLHGMHILHRDLKPANIFIDKKGNCRVADYGLAYNLRQFKKPTGRAGTVIYMAPEVAERTVYDQMADWFGIGVIIYEMATGKHPFMDRMLQRYEEFGGMKTNRAELDGSDIRWGLDGVTYPSKYMGNTLTDLVINLTNKSYANRLCTGSRGARDLKKHPYFQQLDWDRVFHNNIPQFKQLKVEAMQHIKTYKLAKKSNDDRFRKKEVAFHAEHEIKQEHGEIAPDWVEDLTFKKLLTW